MSEFNSTLGPKINNTDREAREAREREREAREARHTRTYKPMQKTKTKTKKKKKLLSHAWHRGTPSSPSRSCCPSAQCQPVTNDAVSEWVSGRHQSQRHTKTHKDTQTHTSSTQTHTDTHKQHTSFKKLSTAVSSESSRKRVPRRYSTSPCDRSSGMPVESIMFRRLINRLALRRTMRNACAHRSLNSVHCQGGGGGGGGGGGTTVKANGEHSQAKLKKITIRR